MRLGWTLNPLRAGYTLRLLLMPLADGRNLWSSAGWIKLQTVCALCVRLATEEMGEPGYSRVEGVDLALIKSTIVKIQRDFLR